MKVYFKINDLMEMANVNSISQLADLVGIRRAALSELANGKRKRIQFEHLERIAEALKITDLRDIIDFIEENEDKQKDR